MDDSPDRVIACHPDLGRRLQLAFAGLHPDTIGGLLAAHGASGALRRIVSHRNGNERSRRAAAVSAEDRLEQLATMGFAVVFRGRPGYPTGLGELPDTPDVLFVKGRLPEHPAIAVVGTRRCTPYGRNLATAYGRAVAEAGWVLVSGLARGIDGAAHHGTVTGGGVGTAVLGCGLDVAYPREHARLRDELLELGGAIISEYPPGTPPEAWRFPPRNRIISGLSRAVVVVEAAVKGGALITANAALDQGISVFATPGDIGRVASAGCNLLIRDGAHPVLDPADLIAELELVVGTAQTPGTATRWPWRGVSAGQLATSRAVSVPQAAAELARAELTGELVRRGSRYYPSGAVRVN